jgi:hypothetical protein
MKKVFNFILDRGQNEHYYKSKYSIFLPFKVENDKRSDEIKIEYLLTTSKVTNYFQTQSKSTGIELISYVLR